MNMREKAAARREALRRMLEEGPAMRAVELHERLRALGHECSPSAIYFDFKLLGATQVGLGWCIPKEAAA